MVPEVDGLFGITIVPLHIAYIVYGIGYTVYILYHIGLIESLQDE